jgi:hypothetical protein
MLLREGCDYVCDQMACRKIAVTGCVLELEGNCGQVTRGKLPFVLHLTRGAECVHVRGTRAVITFGGVALHSVQLVSSIYAVLSSILSHTLTSARMVLQLHSEYQLAPTARCTTAMLR